jgi:hypothetical protein
MNFLRIFNYFCVKNNFYRGWPNENYSLAIIIELNLIIN